MHVNIISSKDTGEIRTIYVWCDNEEIRQGEETDDIIKRLLNSFWNNYQQEELILRNGSEFVFESVDLLSYTFHKISLKRGKSYIKYPQWVINKKATINPKNIFYLFSFHLSLFILIKKKTLQGLQAL